MPEFLLAKVLNVGDKAFVLRYSLIKKEYILNYFSSSTFC